MNRISRRSLLAGGVTAAVAAVGSAVTIAGRRFGLVPPDAGGIFAAGNTLNYAAHRLFGRNALAREFPRSMIAEKPFANTIAPPSEAFARHQAEHFANWTLDVRGSVDTPRPLSVHALRGMAVRSQITAVTCEEGWSYVAEWTGTPLSAVLQACGVRPSARYVVYFAADGWMDSIDIDEAMHPQTLVTWGMNGGDLPVAFGGPLRMRVPRQLGYKSVKFIERLLVTDTVADLKISTGVRNYAWYSGI
ncbi:MAG: molybdopterin-dependent oxidoreductase [Gemmatimonadaceae bacterium]|nr:molybdopterin-dependent oxidoreductase [Gemmatimonadaceae bacterium]